jgi:hypothetical protein
MKAIIFSLAIGAIVASCNNGNNSSNKTSNTDSTSKNVNSNASVDRPAVISDEVVDAYLQLKNALTKDNAKDAAVAGKKLREAMRKLDGASFLPEQKKVYDETREDINEHAEHIGDNASNIAHQREHFDLLSKDMADLVKAIKPARTLYNDYCPMYNENKGATWLSETKEIQNPYYGKKMITCGTVKEEIMP